MNFRLFALLLTICLISGPAAALHRGYYNQPDIHEDTIVFTSEGDLWLVGTEGGTARRLTSGEGMEFHPRFSPDGEQIAFAAEYGGNTDVYVMPAEGGEPRRLTWHPYSDVPSGWSPDGADIHYFTARSHHRYDRHTFTVPADGGVPMMVPVGRAAYLKMAEDGRTVAFNRNYVQPRTWKRYKGGLAADLWVGDVEAGQFEKITTFPGNDFSPLFLGDRIYFTSERDGRLNLWSLTRGGQDLQQHTAFDDFDARHTETDGTRIVFQHGADLRLFDPAKGETEMVEILLPTDRPQIKPRLPKASDFIDSFAISNDGKKALLTVRGDVFNVPVKSGRVRPLTETPQAREANAVFAGPEQELALFFSDRSDDYELYTADARTGRDVERITDPEDPGRGFLQPFFDLRPSPDGHAVAFSDPVGTLYWTNLTTKTLNIVDDSDVWEIRDYEWSPEGRYIAYTMAQENEFSRIFLHDRETTSSVPVTDPLTGSFLPSFDPAGDYLFFISGRTMNRQGGAFEYENVMVDADKIYLLPLHEEAPNPFQATDPYEEDDEEEASKKEEDGDKKDEKGKGDKKEEFDLRDAPRRAIEFPMPSGDYSRLVAVKDKIFYFDRKNRALRTIKYKDDDAEPQVFLEGPERWTFSTNREYIVYWKSGAMRVAKTSADKASNDDPEVQLGAVRLLVNPQDEWKQIFREAYRYNRDYFYTPDFANQDWAAIAERYRPLLDRISIRQELTAILAQVVAELGHGHTYVMGDGDAPGAEGISTGLLGVDFGVSETTGTVTLERIYRGERWNLELRSPLNTAKTEEVQEGWHLLEVNGKPVTPEENPLAHFWGLAGEEVALLLSPNGAPEDGKTYRVRLIGDENALRHHAWVEGNRQRVAELTDGQIGYVYLSNMSTQGLSEFYRQFYPQLDKKALVIDVRWNGGGNVSQLIIRRLAAQLYAYFKSRNFEKPDTVPASVMTGPMACLINGRAGSDGDIFSQSFRNFELGPLIGTRTWGGVVGIRYQTQFIDGSRITVPEFAYVDPEAGFGIENEGISPDPGFEVPLLPEDEVNDRDPQLQAAVDYLLAEMDKPEYQRPEIPKVPDRSVEAFRDFAERWLEIP